MLNVIVPDYDDNTYHSDSDNKHDKSSIKA